MKLLIEHSAAATGDGKLAFVVQWDVKVVRLIPRVCACCAGSGAAAEEPCEGQPLAESGLVHREAGGAWWGLIT